jgi:hypothetical protein
VVKGKYSGVEVLASSNRGRRKTKKQQFVIVAFEAVTDLGTSDFLFLPCLFTTRVVLIAIKPSSSSCSGTAG